MPNFTYHFHPTLSDQALADLSVIYHACMKQSASSISSGFDDQEDSADAYLIVSKGAAHAPCAYAAVFELEKTAFVYAFVHPDFRRQGLFTNMISHLQRHYPDLRLDFPADEKEPAVRHMLGTRRFICQEKQLLLTYVLKQSAFSECTDISIIPTNDRFLLYSLHERIFTDFPKNTHEMFIDQMMSLEDIQPYVFAAPHVFSFSQPFSLGMGFLLKEKNTACLCSFGILPSFQNKGYGRAALQALCHMLADDPDITLLQVQVDAKNIAAAALYENFGFQERDVFASYTYLQK